MSFLIPERREGAICGAESAASTDVHEHHDRIYLSAADGQKLHHRGAAGWTLHSTDALKMEG